MNTYIPPRRVDKWVTNAKKFERMKEQQQEITEDKPASLNDILDDTLNKIIQHIRNDNTKYHLKDSDITKIAMTVLKHIKMHGKLSEDDYCKSLFDKFNPFE